MPAAVNRPAEPPSDGAKLHPRRFGWIGGAMIGTAAMLWLGAASVVAYRLAYPPFLEDGHTDIYGPHAPIADASAPGDPRVAFGAQFESLTIPVEDQSAAAAWFVAGKLPTAVLLMPPAGADRRAMLPYMKFLHAAGYATLALVSGDSPARGTRWGWRERAVVLAGAGDLKRRGFTQIAGLGVAEGAAAILLAQAERPVFTAIIADSAYRNLAAMFQRIPSIAGLNPAFSQTVMLEAGMFMGHSLWRIDPGRAARKLGGAALLVIQNRGDKIVTVADAEAIRDAAGSSHAELWIVPADGHGDAIYEDPGGYAAHITAFLHSHLQERRQD
ncbi:MAG TPA: alpha/beta hydrolase [Candidatus Binataceae bacterium]|nr:alpha/beta hydrolase [Candidatus Binataceae bacterium]